MTFDKKKYWDRRHNKYEVKTEEDGEVTVIEAPMRGQEDLTPEPKIVTIPQTGTLRILGKEIPANRKLRRKRIIDRKFSKKGYRNGIKIKK